MHEAKYVLLVAAVFVIHGLFVGFWIGERQWKMAAIGVVTWIQLGYLFWKMVHE